MLTVSSVAGKTGGVVIGVIIGVFLVAAVLVIILVTIINGKRMKTRYCVYTIILHSW